MTDTDAELIATEIKNFTEGGVYTDPLGLSSGKIIAWNDTSNLPSQKLTKSTKTIKLKESDLRGIVRECECRILNETEYKPISHNKTITLTSGTRVKLLVTISDGAGRYDIYEDDGCYVVRDMNMRKDKDYHPWYVFPDMH